MKPYAYTYIIMFAVMCAYQPAVADSLRCGNTLIKVDDSKLKVMQGCGEPKYKDVISGSDEAKVEEWVYQHGERDFPKVLTIRGQKVIRIETLTE
jgi:hypothetical protein